MILGDKTFLVTGGAVRIGRAICESLAAHGAHVVIHYRQSGEAAEELARKLEAGGTRAFMVCADLSEPEACESLIPEAVGKTGSLEGLINNASVFHKDTLRTLDTEIILGEFQVNLVAPLVLMRSFARECGSGKIVNLLDRRITSLDTSCVPYTLSKKALAEATRMAALEWAPHITVNGVAPGAVLPPPGHGPEYLKTQVGKAPLETRCTERDVAEAVLFLLQNDVMTGQVIYVDGGMHLQTEEEKPL